MPAKTTSSAMGLPILKPRVVYLTTSATPNAVLSMKPQVPGIISSAAAANADGTVTVTYTSTNPHGLLVGAVGFSVTVSGGSPAALNGTFSDTYGALSVTSDTVFTYRVPSAANLLNLGGVAANATYGCFFQKALLIADAANSQANPISFGPNQNADMDTVPYGSDFGLDAPSGGKLDLADYYFKSASASQVMRVHIT